MMIKKISFLEVIALCAVTMLPGIVVASPIVEDYVISWSEEGWHQVQLQSTYESVCNGGRQCTVPAGVYTVINHGTGQRFANVVVPNINTSRDDEPRAPVTATGQIRSYAAGDDGDYQLGTSAVGQRFKDNGDGTFEDTLTGLTWLGDRNCVPLFTWQTGVDFANSLSASSGDCPSLSDDSEAGDWRMPNIRELSSLMNYSVAFPAWEPDIPFSGDWLEDKVAGVFWSSTSFQGFSPEEVAYTLNSGVGLSQSTTKTSGRQYVLPVRDSR